jgi:eukaryotic-like serine/threonine-protein kinase
MTPERWQQIDNLLQSALACASEERPAFLAQACADDEPLRREVESLLASHEHSGNLLETPLSQIAADLLVESQPPSVEGQTIGLYKVLTRLGAGGMGEVYLAQDPRLDRKIALKLLPAYFTTEANRIHRFEQEARAASSLNHPNILTIYEIGQADGHHFIATEFINGVTLRERLAGTPMKLSEALEIALQVAAALTAAHAANIVHRDIKPENIMIRDDGYMKVLDFGLAKLTERSAAVDTEAATRAMVKTNPGVVMGTVAYMSPEQARGLSVDARTDIWSLGVVLYEMATGRVPFEGETATDVILSVVEREPPPLAQYSREVPAELERIVNKALRKNRDERYQTVKDLSLDLKSLKQELEVARLDRSLEPFASGQDAAKKSSGRAAVATTSDKLKFVEHPTSSAEYIVSEIKSHKRSVVLALAILVIAVAAAVYFFYFAKGGETIDSVAVMPFVNVSGDPNTEYLSDGLSDSIINSLSQLPNLKVIALNSVLRYKGKQTDPQVVGRELNVRAVLMGRLIQQGDGLSISTELVDVRDNRRLWGEQYNRKLADIAVLQTDIAQEISERLRLRLSGEEKKRLTKRYTDNGEAYQLYLMGRSYLHTRSDKGLQKSIELFEQAIKKDPNYAPAYAGLSLTYQTLGFTGLLPAKEARQKQEWAALKAMEIDDMLAEAHVAVALVRRLDLNWSASEEEGKRALELDPNSVGAHVTYAYHLAWLGRLDEAMPHVKRAQELDPLSLITSADIGNMFYCSRQYDRAIEQFQKIIQMDPNFAPAHTRLGMVYLEKGMYEEAITEHKKAIALDDSPGRWGRTALLGHAYAVAGRKAEAQKILDDLKGLSKQRDVSPYNFALIYMGLGDKDQAFVWLEKTFEERPDILYDIKVGPRFDSLRSDPRFTDLLRRMKLAP